MTRRPIVLGPLLAALAVCAAACGSTAHARKIVTAGAAYGRATDALLSVTQETAVDADSARLLSEARGLSRDERRALLAKHGGVSQVNADLERLRRHARLLTRYFEALGRLAADDADAAAADATEAAASALNKLGTELSGSPLLDASERDLLAQTASLSVQAVRRAAIDKELKARASAIDREIAVQQTMLDAVRRKLRADMATVASLGRERDVTRPFVDDAISDPRGWMALRRGYVLAAPDDGALKDASSAASKLRTAWKAFAAGGFDETARESLLSDLEEVVAYAETVRKAVR